MCFLRFNLMNHRLKCKTIKLLDDNTGEILAGPGFGDYDQNMISKA